MAIDIQRFIQDSRQKGMSDDAIRSALANMGIDQMEVDSAIPTTHVATETDGEPIRETVHRISDFIDPVGAVAQPTTETAQKATELVEEVTVVSGPDIPNPRKKIVILSGIAIVIIGVAVYFLIIK